tara:strand:+ start:2704 stop:3462 length:759 start_codon:yes stop_codon:yes gene_type:complete
MSSFEIPELIQLDIIDLNKRLRKRRKIEQNSLWDLLPDDVMPHIVKHKVKMDFDDDWDYNFVISKYNSLYNPSSLSVIASNIIDSNNWDFTFNDPCPYDDSYGNYKYREEKDMIRFVIEKLENQNNLDYLNHFKKYTKPEVVLKRFDVGNTYYRTFKNTETKQTIKIPFTITKRDDVKTIGLDCKGNFTAVIDDTDVDVRLSVDYEEDKKKKDDNNLYLNEYTNIYLGANKKLEKYLKQNNLKAIRYRIDAK